MRSVEKNLLALVGMAMLVGCFSKPKFNGSDDANSVDAAPDALVPPEMAIDPRGPQRLSASANHACSIDNAGHLRCWGDNSEGQLGVGNTAIVEQPTQVGQETGWTAISTGTSHTCGIQNATAYCWGNNARNEVGGSGASVVSPRAVVFPFTGFVIDNIFALDRATCATGKRDGADQLYCWGSVEPGQTLDLGSVSQPTQIADNPPTTKWTKISGARGHRCALRDDGAVYCWGSNGFGQAGAAVAVVGSDEEVALDSAPRIGALTYIDIATGQNSSCAVTSDRRLQCWGWPNERIAPPASANPHLPREVRLEGSAPSNFRTISIGFYFACATDMTGAVLCFGEDDNGALGYAVNVGEGFFQGTATPRRAQLVAQGPAPQVGTLVTGFAFACVRTLSGAPVLCWGAQDRGQLGIGNHARRATPAPAALNLPTDATVLSMAAGAYHTCVSIQRVGGDTNSCWGANFSSQVTGVASDNSTAMISTPPDPTIYESELLVAGRDNSCSILPGRTNVACWGNNDRRQLGPSSGTRYNDVTPLSPTGGSWSLVATNANAACAVEQTAATPIAETLRCWGQRLGIANAPETLYTPGIPGVTNPVFEQLALGNGFGMALIRTVTPATRSVMTWGSGDEGQLSPMGGGTRGDLQTALTVPAAATDVSLAPSEDGGHACVSWIENSVATVRCWGRNNQNQLGSLVATNDYRPTMPNGFVTRKVVTAADHSCALSSAGAIACWGSGYDLFDGPIGENPQLFGAGTVWADLVTGREHICAVSTNRRVVQCWGTSKFGQFGNGARYHPDPVPALVAR